MKPNSDVSAANTIRVIALSVNKNSVISEAFGAPSDFSLDWMSPTEVDAIANRAPHLLVIEAGLDIPCYDLIQAAKGWAYKPAIITLGDVPMTDLRALIGYPKANALTEHISPAELSALAAEIATPGTSGNGDQKSGECWAIVGSVGGCGASLITIETACHLLHRSKRSVKVCLIDLNFEDGSLASYLDLSPGLDLQALTASPDRLDAALCSAFVSEHNSGLHLIAAPRGAQIGLDVRPECVLKLLDIACELYDYVVLDVPRWRQSWTKSIALGADQLIIMSELTVPALHAARHLSEDFEAMSDHVADPHIILNRMSKRVFGHSVTVRQAESALKRKALASVSSDWDAAVSAVNMGLPVAFARPGSKMSRDVADFVNLIIENASANDNMKVA